MQLKPLTLSDVEQTRQWRNNSLAMLRTPFLLTKEMQETFYRDVICNRNANARFWGINLGTLYLLEGSTTEIRTNVLIGMTGLVNISWENRNTEVSLILDPDCQGKGYGTQALNLLLDQGFNYLNIENIYGECYTSNPATKFWKKMCLKYGAESTILPKRKYWEGKYWDSLYFNFNKEKYDEHIISKLSRSSD